jgi:death-on-curing protein
LARSVVETIHNAQIREHGGAVGLRDESVLESALGRPQNKFAYGEGLDLAALAAAYAFGIAKNHPFVDGNKRTAFVSAALFLSMNGFEFVVAEPDVATTIERLAAGKITEAKLTEWFRAGMRPLEWK